MPTFDLNNFVIDRAIRGLMVSQGDGSLMWSINQVTEPSLSVTTETAQSVDAIGTTIAEFNRGKQAEFRAQNSLFDLGLYAAQNGTDKEVAGVGHTIIAPAFEEIVVPNVLSTPVTLNHTPVEHPTAIYLLSGDGTLGEQLVYSSTAGAGKFTYDDATHAITFASSGATAGTTYFVNYEYESEEAVAVTGDAVNFPRAGKFYLEVLGYDVCNQTDQIHAFVVFPNAKLDGNVDVTFTTEGTHPFTIRAQQAYCDTQKRLFRIIIPKED